METFIDTDTHVVEPPDLWTSRMSKRWGDAIPHVRPDPNFGDDAWFVRDVRIFPVAGAAHVGWPEHPPSYPPRWEDADPATWDAGKRLRYMDDNGVRAQILYPNIAMFRIAALTSLKDLEHAIEIIRAYNDWQTEYASVAPERLIPVTSLPFFDLDASLKELERCAALGHRALAFSQDPSVYGLPALADAQWHPLWASAQEKGIPVNFHIGSANTSVNVALSASTPDIPGEHASFAARGATLFMSNARTFAALTCGGVCHSFPELKFVSVESGIGWIPFTLEALDWQWQTCGVADEHPEYDLLPSEYFKRQIYGCFWFERDCAIDAIHRLGVDNVLYETDFPHASCMSAGLRDVEISPQEYIAQALAEIAPADRRKVLHDNAAGLYGLD